MGEKVKLSDLISKDALRQNNLLHQAPEGFGGSGWRHASEVHAFAQQLGARDILDYGCGEGTLVIGLKELGCKYPIKQYDPALPEHAALPKPADLVVCTDVLEHVEPFAVENVMRHLFTLTRRGCYLVIATRPANKMLPDGRNAHLIIEDTPFWDELVKKQPWTVLHRLDRRKGNVPEGKPHEVRYWLAV